MAEHRSNTVPPRVKDLTGMTFGKLTVISFVGTTPRHYAIWLVRCECGTTREIESRYLMAGQVSCRCMMGAPTHGHTRGNTRGKPRSKVYRTWCDMIRRCTQRNRRDFKYYGGRDVTVCTRWRDFVNFLEDMGEPLSNDLSIDRIDNNGNYEPGNCRWATQAEQTSNSRHNRYLTFHGKTQCLAAWAREVGLSYGCLQKRIRLGWNTERILTTPSRSIP